jgi:methionyl-tRNA synthetase
MNIALQITANLSIILNPFIPNAMTKLREIINLDTTLWKDSANVDLLKSGQQLNESSLLFRRIEDEEIEAQLKKLEDTKKANMEQDNNVEAAKEVVEFDDFQKMDIRIGKIIQAEKVAKTKKLLKLTVDTGIDKRTVVSGIAEYYKADDIIGKQVSILVNLKPRKIRGIESQGMILMAENFDGKLGFINPDDDFKPGSTIK